MSTFTESTDAPIALGKHTFSRLTIRMTAKLCAKYQASQAEKLKKLVAEENLSAEAKVRFLGMTVGSDFGLSNLWDWAQTAEGAVEIIAGSLAQDGKSEADANKIIDTLTGRQAQELAMEIVDHENSPSRILIRQKEAEAKAKEKPNPQ